MESLLPTQGKPVSHQTRHLFIPPSPWTSKSSLPTYGRTTLSQLQSIDFSPRGVGLESQAYRSVPLKCRWWAKRGGQVASRCGSDEAWGVCLPKTSQRHFPRPPKGLTNWLCGSKTNPKKGLSPLTVPIPSLADLHLCSFRTLELGSLIRKHPFPLAGWERSSTGGTRRQGWTHSPGGRWARPLQPCDKDFLSPIKGRERYSFSHPCPLPHRAYLVWTPAHTELVFGPSLCLHPGRGVPKRYWGRMNWSLGCPEQAHRLSWPMSG